MLAVDASRFGLLSLAIVLPIFVIGLGIKFPFLQFLTTRNAPWSKKTLYEDIANALFIIAGIAVFILGMLTFLFFDNNKSATIVKHLNEKIAHCVEAGGIPTVSQGDNFDACTLP